MNELDKFKDDSAKLAFGRTKSEAHVTRTCIHCRARIFFCDEDSPEAGPGAIFTPEGKAEYGISGMCEHCWDNLFAEEPPYEVCGGEEPTTPEDC
jgi:hypothetical protein